MGQKTDWGALAQDTVFNGITGGAFEYLPGVPGRLPNLFSRAFFTGRTPKTPSLSNSPVQARSN
jgi:hypothetical protein